MNPAATPQTFFRTLTLMLFPLLFIFAVGCGSSDDDDDGDGAGGSPPAAEESGGGDSARGDSASIPDVSGNWTLTGSGLWTAPADRAGESHTVSDSLSITQSGGGISGTSSQSGAFTGSVDANGNVSFTTRPESTIVYSGRVTGNQITGTYRSTFDEFVREGTFTMSR